MKTLITDYAFNSAAKTITFTGKAAVDLSRILIITNITDNIIIFNFADQAKTGTVSGNVLTLDFDTLSMSNGDILQIWYWEETLITLLRVDSGNPLITYVGKAVPGTSTASGVWSIKRITTSGENVDIHYADSNDRYDNIFDDREILSYG